MMCRQLYSRVVSSVSTIMVPKRFEKWSFLRILVDTTQFFQKTCELVVRNVLDIPFVDGDHRRSATRSHAFHFFEGKASVRRPFHMADLQIAPSLLEKTLTAAEKAADVRADLHMMLSHRFLPIHRVKRRDPLHMGEGEIERVGDMLHD